VLTELQMERRGMLPVRDLVPATSTKANRGFRRPWLPDNF